MFTKNSAIICLTVLAGYCSMPCVVGITHEVQRSAKKTRADFETVAEVAKTTAFNTHFDVNFLRSFPRRRESSLGDSQSLFPFFWVRLDSRLRGNDDFLADTITHVLPRFYRGKKYMLKAPVANTSGDLNSGESGYGNSSFEVPSSDDQLEHRFRQEAPKAWDRHRRKLFNMPRESNVQIESSYSTDITSHAVRRVGKHGRLIESAFNGKTRVTASNSRYRFRILKDPGTGWRIGSIEVKKRRSPDSYRWFDEDPYDRGDLELGLLVGFSGLTLQELRGVQISLPSMVFGENKDRFTIESIQQHSENGIRVVRIKFDFVYLRLEGELHEQFPNTNLRGEIVLLPDNDWMVQSWRFSFFNFDTQQPIDDHYEFSAQYRDLKSDPIALPVKTEYRHYSHQRGTLHHSITNYVPKSWDGPKCSESELTLSAYGLPEPPDLPRGGSLWFLWVSVAGVVLLAGGVFLYRKFR